MHWLRDPHLDLSQSRIETDRCVIVPFSLDLIRVEDIWAAYCQANRHHFVSPHTPETPEDEEKFLSSVRVSIEKREVFENFIFEKESRQFLGCIGLNRADESSMNIGLWICVDQHGKGFGKEVYHAMIEWAREHTTHISLRHFCHPGNEASRRLALGAGGVYQGNTDQGDEKYSIFLDG